MLVKPSACIEGSEKHEGVLLIPDQVKLFKAQTRRTITTPRSKKNKVIQRMLDRIFLCMNAGRKKDKARRDL